jgi:glycosyltransferase involved in cell wall biosynthesis
MRKNNKNIVRKPIIAAPISVPPPVHGSNIMNQLVLDLLSKNDSWKVIGMPLQFTKSVTDIGTAGPFKILNHLMMLTRISLRLAFLRPDITYLSPAVSGLAGIRDSLLVVASRVFSRDVIVHIHGRGLSSKSPNYLSTKFKEVIFKNTRAIHLSQGLAQSIKHVTQWKSLDVLQNAIESSSVPQSRPKEGQGKVNLLYLSNFIESKGVLDFIDVCQQLKTNGTPFHALLVGGPGPVIDNDILKERISRADLTEEVSLLGPKYGKEKLKVLDQADVFIFPSYYSQECAPLVILEAFSFSLPVVAYEIGAVAEMVQDGESGFVVESRDTKTLSARITALIENKELRNKFSIAARERFKTNYTLQEFNKRLDHYFENLVQDPKD